jgi:hypothetical protein
MVVGISAQILTAAERQGLPFGTIDRMHLAEVNRMIAPWYSREHLTLKPSAATSQQRHTAEADIDIKAGEFLLGRPRKPI